MFSTNSNLDCKFVNLLEKVSSFENLEHAFKECSRRKRNCNGYLNMLQLNGERLLSLKENLLQNKYEWGNYREFWVCDPKKRLVMAAPFVDRVVHHAIHRIIEPILDKNLSDSVFACRHGRGNRSAVQILFRKLNQIPKQTRYVLKLDIRQYFPSINHKILTHQLLHQMPDQSLKKLLEDLLKSHPKFSQLGVGIPIGNLTSQLFANLYISELDRIACEGLGSPFFWNEMSDLNPTSFYIRYMDDLVFVSDNKKKVCSTAANVISYAKEVLKLDIPVYKRIHLGNAGVPFLGFLLDKTCEPLSRNKRRIRRKIKRLHSKLIGPNSNNKIKISDLEMVVQSYKAWSTIEQ